MVTHTGYKTAFFFLSLSFLSLSSSSSSNFYSTTSPYIVRATCCHFTDLPPDGDKGAIAESRLVSKALEVWGLENGQGFCALGWEAGGSRWWSSWALPSRHGKGDPIPDLGPLTPRQTRVWGSEMNTELELRNLGSSVNSCCTLSEPPNCPGSVAVSTYKPHLCLFASVILFTWHALPSIVCLFNRPT